MSVSQASQDRYSSLLRQATYLEAEWSDYLLGSKNNDHISINPMNTVIFPSFYLDAAELIITWLKKYHVTNVKYCDIGCATGRMAFELSARFNFK